MSSRWVAVALLCAGLCGCNNARLVRWDGATGVVAIPHDDNDWPDKNRDHALAIMKEHCPQGYTIVSEQMVDVGGTVDHTVTRVGYMRVRETSYHPVQEWHLTFQSNNAPPASILRPPPPGPPAPILPASAVVPAQPVASPPPPGLPPAPIPVGP